MQRPTPDHVYVWSIVGRCLRCQRLAEEHPIFLSPDPDKPEGCLVDHNSLITHQLIGDLGMSWSLCPVCAQMVEPLMAYTGPKGDPYGPGRGHLTERHKLRLMKVRRREDFNLWLESRKN